MVGIEAIPAILDVGPEDDSSILAKQLVENLQREDLSSLERALAIGQLRDSFKLSVRDIAKQLGLSKSLIQRSIEVLQLPDDLQAALIAGASESKILLLSQIKNRQLRKELLQKLEELSRKQIEQIVSKGREKTSKVSHGGTDKKSSKKMSTADKNIAEEIQRSIGTKVQVLRNAKGGKKGKVILEFYSDSDLDEIYRRLSER
jgi:ParB family chromosome partitioning protein